MSIPAESIPPFPESYYQDQAMALRHLQLQISDDLFISGAAPRIAATMQPGSRAGAAYKGLDLWDKICVPSRVNTVYPDGNTEQVIMLTLITEAPGVVQCTHFYLGAVDSIDMFYPYPDVETSAAELVLESARHLQKARDEGILPDLNFGLLKIDNPYENRGLPPPQAP